MRAALCTLLCAASAACLTTVGPAPLRASERAAASREDVNILMYGVLQFSETLHHVYQSTEAKMERIARALRGHEGALERLGREALATDGQIKEMLRLLQVQMAGLRAQTDRTLEGLALATRGEEELKRQVTELETSLANSSPDRVKELQERAKKHSGVLRILLRWNQRQKQNLELQNRRLAKLERSITG